MKIIPLSEGSFTIDQSKQFIPFISGDDSLKDRSSGSLLVEIQPFLVVTSKDVLLLDTGLGFHEGGIPQLHQNILNAGFQPNEVTKVLLTHLHKDHAGGVGKGEDLSLPNALYYIQEKELEFAFEKGFPSFITEELECLRNNSRVVLLDGDGIIGNYIQHEVTGAHSPFHQVFKIGDEDKMIFFGGDDAPQLYQMKTRFVAKYDSDGRRAMELRQKWWSQGKEEKWIFLFYHDIKTPYLTP